MHDRDAFTDLPAPPPAGASVDVWRAAIRALPVEARVAFASLFTPAAINAARDEARDLALAELVADREGSASALAGEVHRTLTRYAASGWKFDQANAQPREFRHRAAHSFLRHSSGKVPSINRLRIIIGQKKLITKTGGSDQLSARDC